MYEMKIETIHDCEFLVFSIPRLMSQQDWEKMFDELKFGLRRATSQYKTFLALIDFDYTIRHLSSISWMYRELEFLAELPKPEAEYRIGIVVDENTDDFNQRLENFFTVPETASGWFDKLRVAWDAYATYQNSQDNPALLNSWIKVHTSVDAAANWCVSEAKWS